MRISIVVLYLIVVHGYVVYKKKRPPQSDTSVHVCVFVLYIAVTVSFCFSHCLAPSLTMFKWQLLLWLHFGSQTQWCGWRTHGLPCPNA